MKTKIEIKSIWGKLLFEFECENNSNKLTLEKAIDSCADLRGADLRDADLRDANLSCADLRGADLRDADLRDANLSCADLRGADLRDADFNQNTAFFTLSCPEEGEFIAFKKASNRIVKLLILEDAKRSSATTFKCRASKVKTLSIENIDGSCCNDTSVASDHDKNFIYSVGEIVEVDNFSDDRWEECAPGIHFFMSKEMAKKY